MIAGALFRSWWPGSNREKRERGASLPGGFLGFQGTSPLASGGVAFVLLSSALVNGQTALELDLGPTTIGFTQAHIDLEFDAEIYFGCMTGGEKYRLPGWAGYAAVPAPDPGKDYTVVVVPGVKARCVPQAVANGYNGEPVAYTGTASWYVRLHNAQSVEIQRHTITFNVTAEVVAESLGQSVKIVPLSEVVRFSVTPTETGGMPQADEWYGGPSAPQETEQLELITNVPEWAYDDQERPYQPEPPQYVIPVEGADDVTGTWLPGTNKTTIEVPAGGGPEVPAWVDGFGGTWRSGNTIIAVWDQRDISDWTGTNYTDGSGNSVYEVNGENYGENYTYRFPPNYRGPTVDATAPPPPAGESPDPTPCFAMAWEDLGNDSGGEDPDPVAEAPPAAEDPELPGLPGETGSGGGGGVTGGSSVAPPSGGIGSNTGSEGTPEPSDPNYEAGKPLPGEGAAEAEANRLAREHADNVAEVQESAEGLMGWATIGEGAFGQAGEWTVPVLQTNGQVFAMTIPTDHAPIVRALLLLLVHAMFIIAVFKLLTRAA